MADSTAQTEGLPEATVRPDGGVTFEGRAPVRLRIDGKPFVAHQIARDRVGALKRPGRRSNRLSLRQVDGAQINVKMIRVECRNPSGRRSHKWYVDEVEWDASLLGEKIPKGVSFYGKRPGDGGTFRLDDGGVTYLWEKMIWREYRHTQTRDVVDGLRLLKAKPREFRGPWGPRTRTFWPERSAATDRTIEGVLERKKSEAAKLRARESLDTEGMKTNFGLTGRYLRRYSKGFLRMDQEPPFELKCPFFAPPRHFQCWRDPDSRKRKYLKSDGEEFKDKTAGAVSIRRAARELHISQKAVLSRAAALNIPVGPLPWSSIGNALFTTADGFAKLKAGHINVREAFVASDGKEYLTEQATLKLVRMSLRELRADPALGSLRGTVADDRFGRNKQGSRDRQCYPAPAVRRKAGLPQPGLAAPPAGTKKWGRPKIETRPKQYRLYQRVWQELCELVRENGWSYKKCGKEIKGDKGKSVGYKVVRRAIKHFGSPRNGAH
jgi:hypothetical protein